MSNVVVSGPTTNPVTGLPLYSEEVKLYPVPMTSTLHIESPSAMSQVQLADLQGRTVLSNNVNGTQADLNVESVGIGTYILTIYSTDGVKRVKVVK